MASKWETSPRMRKMFMAPGGLLWGKGRGTLSAGGEGEGREFFPLRASTERTLSSGPTFLFSLVWSPLFWRRKVQAPLSPGRKAPFHCQALKLDVSLAYFSPQGGFSLPTPPGPSSPCSRPKVGVCSLESPRLSLLSSSETSAG